MPYKRIIVAADGSKTSDLAITEALDLSKSLHANLCILYIVDEFPIRSLDYGIDLDKYQAIIREQGLAVLDGAKQMAQKHNVLAEFKFIENTDPSKRVSEKIIEAASAWNADCLVMGTHGRRGFNRLILGSVAEETIRLSPIPVLLIRSEEDT